MKSYLSLVCLLFCLTNFLLAQSIDESKGKKKKNKQTIFQYLNSSEQVPSYVITADFQNFLDNKYLIGDSPASLTIGTGDGVESWDIGISLRGKSRRTICDMPPLKLTFKKSDLKDKSIRKKYNSLKLVSYCKDEKDFENYILREYMAYKLYNILTDYSFNVQLVDIEYRDSKNRMKPVKRRGFLIENTDEMANRKGAKEQSTFQLRRDSVNNFHYDLMSMFQYMISNTDWKITALHNMKVIKDKSDDQIYAVPYDFDYSGFVNSEYAIPNPDYQQLSIHSRIFLGSCKDIDELKPVRELFLQKKSEIMSCPNEMGLSKRKCKKALRFIKKFYKILASNKKFKRNCLKGKFTVDELRTNQSK